MKKTERDKIYNKYGGRCAYCGCVLPEKWHVDHIKPVVRDLKDNSIFEHPENDNFNNYNPSCPPCNIQKNSYSVEQFRINIAQFVDSLNRYNTQYKFAKKFGLVEETSRDVIFYFERNTPPTPQ